MNFTVKIWGVALSLAGALCTGPVSAQRVKTAAFSYVPEQTDDRYNQRVPRKTLPVAGTTDFVVLGHRSATEYSVERYDAELKKVWTAAVPVAAGESIETFAANTEQAMVVIHHKDAAAQYLSVLPINLKSGQKANPQKLIDASPRDRRPGVAISPDGKRILAFRYLTREVQIKAISATLYDQQLTKLKDRIYDFHDLGDLFSPAVHVANDGTQYVTLVSDKMKKLSLRRYRLDTNDVQVLSVAVGGTFGGKAVNVFDTKFTMQPNGVIFGAAICTERETGQYYSLKLVKFDPTQGGDLKFAPEFRFTPEYLAEVNKAGQTSSKRLEDVYLSDVVFTPDSALVVVAEKKYEEGGDDSPTHARELHLFGYNQFQTPTWHTIIAKNQVASPAEGFAGIGYRVAAFGNELQIVTQEKLKNKSDLYLRRVNARTGVVSEPKKLGLNVADQNLAYVKDFTTWLDAKTIIGVSRPNKKSAALMLNKIVSK
ncbi:hypothetical protein HER32_13015 [Hymenobacter sp. BT18]|uniref:hypothetical protein n=1 Tax=Hymenobacter sp. BT18 TaxID=2835648 RepID=UPI00143EE30F|nr:hypothetical protein [Hymenobacter sp. BT18]QIX62057.1 hypothetical protein HER32_13015 [Hymenobacter sp. BT18]